MTKSISTAILCLMFAIFGVASATALPVSQIQGSNWKNECIKQGGSRYACCQGKESACQSGCQSGSSCGPACTQCKNECGASYRVCVAKSVSRPGTVLPSSQPAVRSQ